jgi:hypothetical protein
MSKEKANPLPKVIRKHTKEEIAGTIQIASQTMKSSSKISNK